MKVSSRLFIFFPRFLTTVLAITLKHLINYHNITKSRNLTAMRSQQCLLSTDLGGWSMEQTIHHWASQLPESACWEEEKENRGISCAGSAATESRAESPF